MHRAKPLAFIHFYDAVRVGSYERKSVRQTSIRLAAIPHEAEPQKPRPKERKRRGFWHRFRSETAEAVILVLLKVKGVPSGTKVAPIGAAREPPGSVSDTN